jgi:hypothetical protein
VEEVVADSRAWQALIDQNRPPYAVGTLDEIMEKKLPTRVFPACHEGSPDESIRPCPLFGRCDMSYKGLHSKEGGGPRNHCWERIKSAAQGGGIVRNVHPCYWGVAQQKEAADNDEILRPIADEGEEYEVLTIVPDTTGTRDNLGYHKWDKKLITHTVPAFKRLGQEEKMAEAELRAAIVERDRKRIASEREAKLLGLEGNRTPLDKRKRGEGKVGPKEGG